MITELIEKLHRLNCSCVVANGEEVRVFFARGISDLYDLYKTKPEFLRNSMIADKVIGKGAAALMIESGVKEVYTDLISESALLLFNQAGINIQYEKLVPHIENRDRSDWCPLEKRCASLMSIAEILPVIGDFIAEIRMNQLFVNN